MAAAVGRQLTISRNGSVVAGARTKTCTIGNEPIDITTDDDDGYRTLLEDPAQKQIDMSVEGLLKNDDLIEEAASGAALIQAGVMNLPSGATITGDFRLNNIELGATYNDAITFTAELHSSGAYEFAAASSGS